jgi:hypothetical protein
MILVDTGALYALTDKNDKNHRQAKKFYSSIVGQEILAISLPVLTESWLLLEARLGRSVANKVWGAVHRGVFELLELEREDLKAALEIELKYQDAGFGLVDATCFALCEKHKIRKVFTYDRKHFSLYRPRFVSHLELLPP